MNLSAIYHKWFLETRVGDVCRHRPAVESLSLAVVMSIYKKLLPYNHP